MKSYREIIESLEPYYDKHLRKTLSSYTEKEIIYRLKKELANEKLGNRYEDDAGVCKINTQKIVVSNDSFDEDVHFTFDLYTIKQFYSLSSKVENVLELPFFIGKNAIHKFLSDIYAMGAYPTAYTLDLGIPPNLSLSILLSLYKGIYSEISILPKIEEPILINANLKKSFNGLTISSTIIGKAISHKKLFAIENLISQTYEEAYLYVLGELGISEYLRLYDKRKLSGQFNISDHVILKPPYETIQELCQSKYVDSILYLCDLSDGLFSAFERLILNTGSVINLSEIDYTNSIYLSDDISYGKFFLEHSADLRKTWLFAGDNISYLIVSSDKIEGFPIKRIGTLKKAKKGFKKHNQDSILKNKQSLVKIENFEISDYLYFDQDDIAL